MTKTQFLKDNNGKTVRVIAKNYTDNEALREHILKCLESPEAKAENITMSEDENTFNLSNGQFFWKEKREKESLHTLHLKSTFFMAHARCNKKDFNLVNGGLESEHTRIESL